MLHDSASLAPAVLGLTATCLLWLDHDACLESFCTILPVPSMTQYHANGLLATGILLLDKSCLAATHVEWSDELDCNG